MAWRSVVIAHPAALALKQNALQVQQQTGTALVPLEDIAALVLDHPQITLSAPLLAACAEAGVAVLTVGHNHHPNGVFYAVFRRFLLTDGYDMLQWSVYGRMVNGIDDAQKHLQRLEANLPPEGSVRCLQISEKQFATMRLLVGARSFQEKTVTAEQMLLF